MATGKQTSDGWTGATAIATYLIVDIILCSSVDIATHSTQSVISDEEVFAGCYSDGSSNRIDNTEDEVDDSYDVYHHEINVITGC